MSLHVASDLMYVENTKDDKLFETACVKGAENRVDFNFKPGDRVVRTEGVSGPTGTVQNIRREVTRSSLKPDTSEPPGIAITVLWDNGTISHFVPEGLKKVGEIPRPAASSAS